MNAQIALSLDSRIEALACGDCTEDEFLAEVLAACDSGGLSPWKVVSSIDQRCRRGQLASTISRAVQARIVQRAMDTPFQTDSFVATPTEGLRPAQNDGSDESLRWSDSLAPMAAMGRMFKQRYTLMDIAGAGHRHVIYRATDHFLGLDNSASRTVAVKILRGTTAPSSERLAALRNEFICAQSLSHPAIVTVYDLYCDQDLACYTMEWLEGASLADVLKRTDSLSRGEVWRIVQTLGAALAHAHSRGIVHGDVKPQNVMITPDGTPRLLDFGCARHVDIQKVSVAIPAEANVVTLTPAYASCEVLAGQPALPSDDLYALACAAYQMLASRPPFGEICATDARAMGLRAPRPAGLSNRQWQALQRGLAWTREERGADVSHWLRAMQLDTRTSGQSALPRLRERVRSLLRGQTRPSWAHSPKWWPQLQSPPLPQPTPVHVALRSPKAPYWPHRSLALALLMALIVLAAAAAYVVNNKPQAAANTSMAHRATTPSPAVAPLPGAGALRQAAPPNSAVPASAVLPAATVDAAVTAAAPDAASPPAAAQASLPVPIAPRAEKKATPGVFFATRVVRARRNARFVQVDVIRSRQAPAGESVTWWTEEATAHAGIDYLPQERVVRSFPEGRRRAPLFVTLLDNSKRTSAAEFSVCLEIPGTDALGSRCVRVMLPAQAR